MKDIADISDIQLLVNTFYDSVKKDDTIGHFFHKIIGEDWSHHLPLMYSFWNMVLFAAPGYKGNPVQAHIGIDAKIPITKPDFDRWLQLWTATIDSLFEGEIAEMAKNKGALMANMMQIKIDMAHLGFHTIN